MAPARQRITNGKLDAITTLEPLSKVKELSEKILAGQVRGRIVLDVNA